MIDQTPAGNLCRRTGYQELSHSDAIGTGASGFCVDAFSSREPASASLANAPGNVDAVLAALNAGISPSIFPFKELHVKLAVPDLISNSYFPAVAAIELGCFADEGLDVELELIFPPNKAYEALREGEVDLVAASSHAALAAFPDWKGVKLLCAQAQGMYWFLVMHKDLGVKRGDVAALKGCNIGAAPWVELGLRRLLAEEGLDPVRDDIRIAPVPKLPANPKFNFGVSAARALEERRIDGFWANGMAAEVAVRQDVGTIVLDIRRGDGPKSAFRYTMATIAAAERSLEKHPHFANRVQKAIRRAHAALSHDLALATKIGRKLFPSAEAELIATLIQRDLPFYDTRISTDDFANLNRFALDMGLPTGATTYREVVADGNDG